MDSPIILTMNLLLNEQYINALMGRLGGLGLACSAEQAFYLLSMVTFMKSTFSI